MKHRIKLAVAVLMAAVMMAGCSQLPQGVATEPMRPAPTVAVETTAPAEIARRTADAFEEYWGCE